VFGSFSLSTSHEPYSAFQQPPVKPSWYLPKPRSATQLLRVADISTQTWTTSLRLKKSRPVYGYSAQSSVGRAGSSYSKEILHRAIVLTRPLSLYKRAEQSLKLSQIRQIYLRIAGRTSTQPQYPTVQQISFTKASTLVRNFGVERREL
jgi:hypothetical protein